MKKNYVTDCFGKKQGCEYPECDCIQPTPIEKPLGGEEKAAIDTLAAAIAESGAKITFGLKQSDIDVIEDYASRYGGYGYYTFKDAAKKLAWDSTTLACYFFEWKHTHALKGYVRVDEVVAVLESHKIPMWVNSDVKYGYEYAKKELINQIKQLSK